MCGQSILWRHETGQGHDGFSFGWQKHLIEGGLVVPTPQIQRVGARTAYNDIHPHDLPLHTDVLTMAAGKQS